jgi:rod shape determining protein RodA
VRRGRRAEERRRVADLPLFAAVLALAVFGVAMIYSAGELDVPSAAADAWRRQLVWLGVALAAYAAVVRVPLRWLEWAAPALYGTALLLLLLVLVWPAGSGPRSWIRFGAVGLQPSEFAKVATVLLLARIAAGRKRPPENLWEMWPECVAVAVPAALVMLQPDLGTATIFGVLFLAALVWSGLPWPLVVLAITPFLSLALSFHAAAWGAFFVGLVFFVLRVRPLLSEMLAVLAANVAMGVAVVPLWHRLAPYQRARILAFLQPEADPQGAGWHLIQSRVAIGSGGWFGKGFGAGTQKRLAFLPEQHTDFIFSVVGEELGFLGAATVVLAFAFVLWRALGIAERAEDPFAHTVAFGVFAIWFAHVAENIAMTVGLTPITGIPLPLLSYGGSFLVVCFLGLALLQRIALEARTGI